ncbi:MAG: T9SS type A sorting domain-containing protein, partial [Salinivirgaceae bacterium]|nr:T9SS type A sorting domain-containing protein [Salinivirgaceae bacterium]
KLIQLDFDGDTYEYPVIPAYCIRELFEDVIVTKFNSTQIEFSYTSKSNESYQMSLVDQLGRKIMNQPMNAVVGFNHHTVGIHNCAPGVYLLNLVSLNQQYSKKIILN